MTPKAELQVLGQGGAHAYRFWYTLVGMWGLTEEVSNAVRFADRRGLTNKERFGSRPQPMRT
jgi:hypothetical protein